MADLGLDGQSIETLLAAAATGADGAVVPPIVQTSLFTFDTYQAFEDRMAGRAQDPLYTRVQNPTVAAFENLMAQAEGGEAAVGFASGMAAISSTVLAFVRRETGSPVWNMFIRMPTVCLSVSCGLSELRSAIIRSRPFRRIRPFWKG